MVVIFARIKSDTSLREYCVRRGWEDVRVLSDADVLLRAVRAGRVEVVLANSLIGLGHNVPELVAVLREFVSRKIVLIIPGRINTSEAPQVFLDTLDAISEFKASVARESIAVGLASARRRGVKLGRPATVNAHREDVARLRAQGLTGRAIAQELGMPSSTVFKIIGQL